MAKTVAIGGGVTDSHYLTPALRFRRRKKERVAAK